MAGKRGANVARMTRREFHMAMMDVSILVVLGFAHNRQYLAWLNRQSSHR